MITAQIARYIGIGVMMVVLAKPTSLAQAEATAVKESVVTGTDASESGAPSAKDGAEAKPDRSDGPMSEWAIVIGGNAPVSYDLHILQNGPHPALCTPSSGPSTTRLNAGTAMEIGARWAHIIDIKFFVESMAFEFSPDNLPSRIGCVTGKDASGMAAGLELGVDTPIYGRFNVGVGARVGRVGADVPVDAGTTTAAVSGYNGALIANLGLRMIGDGYKPEHADVFIRAFAGVSGVLLNSVSNPAGTFLLRQPRLAIVFGLTLEIVYNVPMLRNHPIENAPSPAETASAKPLSAAGSPASSSSQDSTVKQHSL